ncbi:MAG: stage II sporulation protein M [Nanoarchaeota archaeon]|nr:stage II sporulation protein M [Nanoarchaeota archaeon]
MAKISSILFSPKKAERHPLEIFFVVIFYTSISIFLSLWILPNQASIAMVFLSIIACLYLVQSTLIVEENKEKNENTESFLLKEHTKTLGFFMMIFFAFLIAFTFWMLVLPSSMTSQIFNLQSATFEDIQTITGRVTAPEAFSIILSNNLRVLLLSIVLALFYGAGALFILAWNASLMGYIIGSLVKNSLGLASLPYAFLKFFIHGIPEILAYFAAALAGSILFITVIRGDIKKDRIKRTFIDISIITIISIILLVIAAGIEAYISPHL